MRPLTDTTLPATGLTIREFARRHRMGPDRVRGMVQRGELGAVNTAARRCGKPRCIILPEHVAAWVAAHQATTATPKPAPRRRRQAGLTDYYPDVETGGTSGKAVRSAD